MSRFKLRLFALFELTLWLTGGLLLSLFAFAVYSQNSNAEKQIANFNYHVDSVQPTPIPPLAEQLSAHDHPLPQTNMALWSEERKQRYFDISADNRATPRAVLYIDSVNLAAPVYFGTDEETLSQGAGWIAYTTALTDKGNIGIAAHRDSFFRALKDIQVNHIIRLKNFHEERHFKVTEYQVVPPSHIDVLKETEQSQLTLITCHPFYYFGKAPNRFIVSAIEIP